MPLRFGPEEMTRRMSRAIVSPVTAPKPPNGPTIEASTPIVNGRGKALVCCVRGAAAGPEPFPIPPRGRDRGETCPREALAEGVPAMIFEAPPAEAAPGAPVPFRRMPRAIARLSGPGHALAIGARAAYKPAPLPARLANTGCRFACEPRETSEMPRMTSKPISGKRCEVTAAGRAVAAQDGKRHGMVRHSGSFERMARRRSVRAPGTQRIDVSMRGQDPRLACSRFIDGLARAGAEGGRKAPADLALEPAAFGAIVVRGGAAPR